MFKSIMSAFVCASSLFAILAQGMCAFGAEASHQTVTLPEIAIEGFAGQRLGLPLGEALRQARFCETPVSYAERLPNGLWRTVCADDYGNEID